MSGRYSLPGPAWQAGRPVLASLALALLAGCTTLGGNVAGDFACRAAQGDCAPASAIDARAIASVAGDTDRPAAAPGLHRTVRAEPGDLARTSERKLRIVFPAHVDAAGIFHEAAVAWAIAEPADWAARARAPETAPGLRAIGRVIADRLEAAQPVSPIPVEETAPGGDLSPLDDPIMPLAMPLASPPALPFTAREAIAGAHAPAIEGFDTKCDRDRTPRSPSNPPLAWPSIEAIEAAHARSSGTPATATTATTAATDPKTPTAPTPEARDSTPAAERNP